MTTTIWDNTHDTQDEIISDIESRLSSVERTLPIAIVGNPSDFSQDDLLTAWKDKNGDITPPSGAKIHILSEGRVSETLQHTSLEGEEEFDNDFLSITYRPPQSHKLLFKGIVPDNSYNTANPFYATWGAEDAEGFDGLEIFAHIGSTNNTAVMDANFQFNVLNSIRHNTQKIAFGDLSVIGARAINDFDVANTLSAPGQLYLAPIYSFYTLRIPYGLRGMVDKGLDLAGVGEYLTVHQQAAPAYTNNYSTYGEFGFEIESLDPIYQVGMSVSLGNVQPFSTLEVYATKANPQ